MTGEDVTPAVMAILRSDFARTCSSTSSPTPPSQVDEQTEQQSMAQIMQSIQAVMMGAGQMLQTGVLPPPQVIQLSLELLRMFLHPVRNARGVIELLDDFKEQLEASLAMAPPPMLGRRRPAGHLHGRRLAAEAVRPGSRRSRRRRTATRHHQPGTAAQRAAAIGDHDG